MTTIITVMITILINATGYQGVTDDVAFMSSVGYQASHYACRHADDDAVIELCSAHCFDIASITDKEEAIYNQPKCKEVFNYWENN